jgi:hypothetical protein
MMPKDALGLVVRVAGLGFILCGIMDLVHLVVAALGVPLTAKSITPIVVLVAAGVWFALGLLLIVSAKPLMRLMYGRDR